MMSFEKRLKTLEQKAKKAENRMVIAGLAIIMTNLSIANHILIGNAVWLRIIRLFFCGTLATALVVLFHTIKEMKK